jgi:hypothetical protein
MTIENLYDRPANPEQSELAENKHRSLTSPYGDLVTMLSIYETYVRQEQRRHAESWCANNFLQEKAFEKAGSVRRELTDIVIKLQKSGVDISSSQSRNGNMLDSVRKAIATTCYYHAARKTGDNGRYKPVHADGSLTSSVFLHPSHGSGLMTIAPKWIVYSSLTVTTKPFMKGVSVIEYEWIKDLLGRIKQTNVYKLTGRQVIPTTLVTLPPLTKEQTEAKEKLEEEKRKEQDRLNEIELGKRKQIEVNVSDAKARYLARKLK